jgi:N-dimethylarginine dimethylaminohydrolase
MGFEYFIHVELSDDNKEELRQLVDIESDDETWGDVIEVEESGIYVCKSIKREIWEGLEELKSYLDKKTLTYTIEEL